MMQIPKKVHDEMIAHAKKGYPNEACGILAGEPGKAGFFYPMRNMDNSPISYFMDSMELLRVTKHIRESGMELCGIFHSHVASEAYPSQKDIRLAFYGDTDTEIFPHASYLIVSLSNADKPVLRSFRIKDENVREEEVEIT